MGRLFLVASRVDVTEELKAIERGYAEEAAIRRLECEYALARWAAIRAQRPIEHRLTREARAAAQAE